MLLKIYKYGAPVLREKCESVEKITPELVELARNMIETMYDANGVGLAAPQIGKTIRLTVIDATVDDDDYNTDIEYPVILFNPEIIIANGSGTMSEGCLSIPNVHKPVVRPERVKVKALNEDGEEVVYEDSGIFARVVQHEIDHLDGILFIDHLSTFDRIAVEPQLLKIKKESQAEEKEETT